MLKDLEQKYIQKSLEVLAKAKATHGRQVDVLNDRALQKYENDLLNATKKELAKIKAEYIVEANRIIDNREAELNTPKPEGSVEEQILEQLQRQNAIKEYEMKYSIMNVDLIIGALQAGLDDKLEFDVAKNIAYSKADSSKKQQITSLMFIDKDLHEVDMARHDVKLLEINTDKYLTGMVTDVDGYITGKDKSNMFFS